MQHCMVVYIAVGFISFLVPQCQRHRRDARWYPECLEGLGGSLLGRTTGHRVTFLGSTMHPATLHPFKTDYLVDRVVILPRQPQFGSASRKRGREKIPKDAAEILCSGRIMASMVSSFRTRRSGRTASQVESLPRFGIKFVPVGNRYPSPHGAASHH
jgi:hypothetical protein